MFHRTHPACAMETLSYFSITVDVKHLFVSQSKSLTFVIPWLKIS